MAPERFDGWSDARTDVYALGATLYELVTLRPAFDGTDPVKLIDQVTQAVPIAPRTHDSRIPRDLETIILKAMAREPAHRYASAQAMADDLERFLSDRTILARRSTWTERTWLWCHRNPVVAGLLAAVAGLLATLAVGSTIAAFRLDGLRLDALASASRAQSAESDMRVQLRRAEKAEAERADQLWESYRARARAARLSHTLGQRFDSLDALAKAARIRVTDELRNEAIACLALPDLTLIRPIGPTALEFQHGYDVDATLERYAHGSPTGEVVVRRVADDGEVARLSSPGIASEGMAFSREGRFLIVSYAARGEDRPHCVWDLERHPPVPILSLERRSWADFSHDSRRLAVVMGDGSIALYELPSGHLHRRLQPGPLPVPSHLRLHPNGRLLAIPSLDANSVRVLDLEQGGTVWEVPLVAPGRRVAWRGDDRLLAIGCEDHRIYVWDAEKRQLQSVLEGHTNSIVDLQFTPSGDALLSSVWDSANRVWDPVRGQLLLTVPGHIIGRVGADGRRVVMKYGNLLHRLTLWELETGRECRARGHRPAGYRVVRRPVTAERAAHEILRGVALGLAVRVRPKTHRATLRATARGACAPGLIRFKSRHSTVMSASARHTGLKV
jgi:hypothetical protein